MEKENNQNKKKKLKLKQILVKTKNFIIKKRIFI